jgi:ethanolamine utilization microcompartment shell protein EutL
MATGCGGDGQAGGDSANASTPAASERGGTIVVGDDSWTIVPAIQCSVYPGNVVSIAGHAAGDSSIEIVIDYGGPTGASVVGEGTSVSWHAIRDTIRIQIDGAHVQGTAMFSKYTSGAGQTRQGSFDVTC